VGAVSSSAFSFQLSAFSNQQSAFSHEPKSTHASNLEAEKKPTTCRNPPQERFTAQESQKAQC
jgi:hypothetical protein